ncbi:MAG: HAD-IIA family hydrolase [Solirubrobacteraceae bacterium]
MTVVPWFDGYALDLDGTVYLGDALLPGAADTVDGLRRRGARIVFATNNPLETAAQYAAKLSRLGIPAEPSDVVTAVDALARYLHCHHAGRTLLLIAEDVVAQRMAEEGFVVTTAADQTEVVVVSFDRRFDYPKLHTAYRAVRHHGAAIVATNPDPYCPTPDGGLPDCAAMLAALEACTGARAEAVVGKPSRHMAATLLERLAADPSATAVVGDRLATDVAMGQQIGATGILVLTGATTARDVELSHITADHVLAGIGQLLSSTDERIPT